MRPERPNWIRVLRPIHRPRRSSAIRLIRKLAVYVQPIVAQQSDQLPESAGDAGVPFRMVLLPESAT
jgi:hypothetical protein